MSNIDLVDKISASCLHMIEYPRSVRLPGLSKSIRVWKGVFDPSLGLTSRYLAETILKHKNYFLSECAFDMGCGTGYLALLMKEHDIAKHICAYEYNDTAYRNAQRNVSHIHKATGRISVIKSDLFGRKPILANFNFERFRFGVHNHSYLSDSTAQAMWHPSDIEGGENLIRRFLTQSKYQMIEGGKVLMPYSTVVPRLHDPQRIAEELNLKSEVIETYYDRNGEHRMIVIHF